MNRSNPDGPGITLNCGGGLKIEQIPPFTESCLPLTIAIAKINRPLLIARMEQSTKAYPFADRVLIWLAPHWQTEIKGFHEADGKGMMERFEEHQLSKFDEYYSETLKSRLESLRSPRP